MSNKVLKPKKASLYEFTQKYSNNIDNCIEFSKSMKWPNGFSFDRFGYRKYYLIKRVGKTKTSYVLECSSYHKRIHYFQALFVIAASLICTRFF